MAWSSIRGHELSESLLTSNAPSSSAFSPTLDTSVW